MTEQGKATMLTKFHKQIAAMMGVPLILIISAWLFFLYRPIVTDEQGLKYTVQPGTSMHAVIDELTKLNVIQHPKLFKLLVKLKGSSHELKSGQYFFSKGTSSSSLLAQITSGKGIVYHIFKIIPGWTFNDIHAALLQDPNINHDTLNLSNNDIMNQIGSPNTNPEGQFYPDSYYFNNGDSDIALLKRAHHEMQEKLKTAWEHRDSDLPYKTDYEALITASLIEKEAKLNIERPVIAGVIINRLNKNMLLQIDPTVIYGMGNRYNGVIHKTDLTEDTPYNTYVHKGLPPTPIAMPGPDSLNAAMHPQKHNFYYFVVKAQGDSAHQFSETLDEHNSAVTEAKKNHVDFFNADLVQRYYSAGNYAE